MDVLILERKSLYDSGQVWFEGLQLSWIVRELVPSDHWKACKFDWVDEAEGACICQELRLLMNFLRCLLQQDCSKENLILHLSSILS